MFFPSPSFSPPPSSSPPPSNLPWFLPPSIPIKLHRFQISIKLLRRQAYPDFHPRQASPISTVFKPPLNSSALKKSKRKSNPLAAVSVAASTTSSSAPELFSQTEISRSPAPPRAPLHIETSLSSLRSSVSPSMTTNTHPRSPRQLNPDNRPWLPQRVSSHPRAVISSLTPPTSPAAARPASSPRSVNVSVVLNFCPWVYKSIRRGGG
ncbi:Uncharacterized protein Rs2_32333 [Raphanus sativus]|nr:Uncharacterized protein Rs2_32333 [Raphanus sativus]